MAEDLRPNIFPAVRYRDADAALEWLKRAFSFEEKAAYRGDDGTIHHAELRFTELVRQIPDIQFPTHHRLPRRNVRPFRPVRCGRRTDVVSYTG